MEHFYDDKQERVSKLRYSPLEHSMTVLHIFIAMVCKHMILTQ